MLCVAFDGLPSCQLTTKWCNFVGNMSVSVFKQSKRHSSVVCYNLVCNMLSFHLLVRSDTNEQTIVEKINNTQKAICLFVAGNTSPAGFVVTVAAFKQLLPHVLTLRAEQCILQTN